MAHSATLPFSFAKRHGVLLETRLADHAAINAIRMPPFSILNELRRWTGVPLKLSLIPEKKFNELLAKQYHTHSDEAMAMAASFTEEMGLSELIQELPKTNDLLEMQDDAPIIRLLNALITEALKLQASDIHIETYEQTLVIRFRIDGLLREILQPQRILSSLIVSRIKVMAKLDIAEKRLPQDGRLSLQMAGENIDVRVSTLPTHHGERVVLRLLDKQQSLLQLNALGMSEKTLNRIQTLVQKPHGILLVTGPTGSGKTTTLYAALNHMNETTRNIMTIEDPIEYDLPGISQTALNNKVNMTFAKGLRAILRQDPDVVMIGEIRDVETAKIAVQASMTGHLVLSTLHTNTALGAITRLIDMNVESFLLSSSLLGILAQRLVRQLCTHCKKPRIATPTECEKLGIDLQTPLTLYDAIGCESCHHTGYRGRTGIYEFISIDETLRNLIHQNHGESAMKMHAHAFAETIQQDGFARVLAGETTLEEILRVTLEEW